MEPQPLQAAPAAQESELLAKTIGSLMCQMDFEIDGHEAPVPVPIHLATARVGDIGLLRYEDYGTLHGHRPMNSVRQDHTDHFVLSIPLSARLSIRHGGVENELLPGYFALVTMQRPIEAMICGLPDKHSFSAMHARIPGPLLRKYFPTVDDFCNRPIPIARGAGYIMRSVMEMSLSESPFLSESELPSLHDVLIDSIACAASVAMDRAPIYMTHRQLSAFKHTLLRAKTFIEGNLSDPELHITQVAEQCGVSARHLQAVFAASSSTVASFIREQRLQRCREALRNPDLRHRAVIDIAGKWGFADPAHFSRVYRARFGVTPRQDRPAKSPAGSLVRYRRRIESDFC